MHTDPINRFDVLGVGVNAIDVNCTVNEIKRWIQQGESHYICVTNVHCVMESQRDGRISDIHNKSGLTVPDGMPLVWIGRLLGFQGIKRVYGPELMLELCRISPENGFTHYLYGGKAGVADELCEKIRTLFPGIKIAGTYTPPFRPLTIEEESELIADVAKKKPNIFWVGLGAPKQEKFMAEYVQKLDTNVMIGVGAAFDIITGRIKDAPDWMKNSGLQWLHRLIQEPHRLWKRYLFNNTLFICKISSSMLMRAVKKMTF